MKLFPLAPFVVALTLTTSGAVAQEADPLYRDFEAIGEFALKVDGKPVAAQIYESQSARCLLLLTPELAGPTMLSLRSRQAETVEKSQLLPQADGSYDLAADAEIKPLGPFEITETGVKITLGGKKLELVTRESLLGLQNRAGMLAYSPAYGRLAATYAPNASLVDTLKKESRAVRLRVYFNSKCSTCKQLLPRILKLEETLGAGKYSFEYYGMKDHLHEDPISEQEKVFSWPTVVVYVGGQEVGRLTAGQLKSPELGLSNTLLAAPAAAK